jgi:hypothetical protein
MGMKSKNTVIGAGAAIAVVAGALVWNAELATAQAPAPPPAVNAPATPPAAVPPTSTATVDKTFDAFHANQGVAVDAKYFYAVDNRIITKYDRNSGMPVLQFVSPDDGPIIHMDSGTVVGHRLYVATSDYDNAPEESSIEIFDTRTMKHVGTHSFGRFIGSLTWLDRHDGRWWAGFANYDEVPDGQNQPYGGTDNTEIVTMNDDFQVQQAWGVPREILDRFRPMSNSGGSWGPDNRLWIIGHDLDEVYVMEMPDAGSDLKWIATVHLPGVEGQAIAWDRTSGRKPTLWAIKRSTSQVLTFTADYASIKEPAATAYRINGPGHFVQ